MSIRWTLARWIAPEPIMRDPFPDEDGVFVIGRENRTVWSIKADRFRMKATRNVRRYDFGSGSIPDFRPQRAFIRFVGTIGGKP